jgi:mono/diheme cytochrome c family protein
MRAVVTALIVIAGLTLGASEVSAQTKGGDPKLAAIKNPVAANAASIAAGRAVYGKQCRHCHGLKGLGDGPLAPKNPKPANLTDATWDYGSSDGEIFTLIKNGAPTPKTDMKGMKGTLADKDIWNIVNFIRTIGPAGSPPKKS